jgi:hypothetical protein
MFQSSFHILTCMIALNSSSQAVANPCKSYAVGFYFLPRAYIAWLPPRIAKVKN